MFYISSRFEKEIIKLWDYFHVWLGLYANLLVVFFSFVFCFFWHVGLPGFWGFGVLGVWPVYFVLIIPFSRFQYFNLQFGSLMLCFTNLVLEIQDNLSLIFLSSLEISNLIHFTHFRLSPIIMGHISKIQAQVCPICQNLSQSKTIRL